MKMKLYACQTKYGMNVPRCFWDDNTLEKVYQRLTESGDVRISEIIEVDFPELPQDVVIDSQIQAIDQNEGVHFAAIQALKQKRQ